MSFNSLETINFSRKQSKMKTKSILQTFLLSLLLGVWGSFSIDTNAQGCSFEDAYDSPYIQEIVESDTAFPTGFGGCFFTQQYILFEYDGEAYVRTVAGYNSLNQETGVGCPAPDIADIFYDCDGNYICGFGFTGPPADPDFCNALIAASAYGTVIWAVDGATTEPAVQKRGFYTYTACIGEVLDIPIHQGGPGLAQPDPPCINDGTFTFTGEVSGSAANGVLSITVDGPGVVVYDFGVGNGTGCVGKWTITIEYDANCTDVCVVDDPFSVPFIQDIVNDNNSCFAYSEIVELEYEGETYFRVEQIIAPTYSPETCPAPDIVNTAYYNCEGNYICGFGFTGSPADPTLCDALVAATPSGTVIWENDFGTGSPVSSAPIFLNNAWLSNVVSEANCSNETVTVYQSGNYEFFYVEDAIGSNLYFQDGTFYCSASPNFDCLGAYGLTTVVDTWTCGDTGNSEMPCGVEDPLTLDFMQIVLGYNDIWVEGTPHCLYLVEIVQFELDGFTFLRRRIESNVNGVSSSGMPCEPYTDYTFYDCVGNEFCSFGDNASEELCADLLAASASGTVIWSYDPSNAPIPNPEPTSPIFTEYAWLTTNNLVNPNNCNGETVMVYSSGIYDFIYIENSSGASLYFQDGTFYCQDAPNFSCVEAYGLNTVSAEWTCGNTPETPNPSESDPVFEEYDWLNNLVNEEDCSNESVSVYTTGTYEFIYIETDAGATLYFEDGTYYCADAPNFSCVAAYGLTSMVSSWTCGESGEENGNEPDFGNYTWLNNVINENDCDANTSVTVYTSGIYSFIHVESVDGSGVLYFQDGTFYCEDASNFSCVSAYSLTEMNSQVLWTCDLGKQGNDGQIPIIEAITAQTNQAGFRLFPNPTTGKVFLELENATESSITESERIDSEQIITVYDLNGRTIKQISLVPDAFNTRIEMDLTDFSTGIYIVELKTSFASTVKRLVIE